MPGHLLIYSLGLWTLRDELAAITGLTPKFAGFGRKHAEAVAGWGHKPTARRARRFAATRASLISPSRTASFARSGQGTRTRPLSLIMDRTGIYYDAREPSDLENMLASGRIHAARKSMTAEAIMARSGATACPNTMMLR